MQNSDPFAKNDDTTSARILPICCPALFSIILFPPYVCMYVRILNELKILKIKGSK